MIHYQVPVHFKDAGKYRPGHGLWSAMTKWIEENKTGNWGWHPGNPGHFFFVNEEDKVKFILRWL